MIYLLLIRYLLYDCCNLFFFLGFFGCVWFFGENISCIFCLGGCFVEIGVLVVWFGFVVFFEIVLLVYVLIFCGLYIILIFGFFGVCDVICRLCVVLIVYGVLDLVYCFFGVSEVVLIFCEVWFFCFVVVCVYV